MNIDADSSGQIPLLSAFRKKFSHIVNDDSCVGFHY